LLGLTTLETSIGNDGEHIVVKRCLEQRNNTSMAMLSWTLITIDFAYAA